ncbi:MAG: Gfo/Idh/MocA family oxidoreductase [Thermoflexales bacterium]|nr:Gfo/Idh/MocA family oxidoreductase [Thermoflexales bacterium]
MAVCRLGIIGVGAMARYHIKQILAQHSDTTQITALCEPDPKQYREAAKLFEAAGQPVPPNEPDFERFLRKRADRIDAAFIITPHNQHYAQAKALLEAGKDVLVEKPMTITVKEAKKLIKVRDKTGRLLAVAFNASMSPAMERARQMLRDGSLGRILGIHVAVWQSWAQFSRGTWRQMPKISGGGFMFDTGAHLLNLVADVLGEPVREVAAFMDKLDYPVDVLTAAIARSRSGAMITVHGCGAAPVTSSDMKVWCENGMLEMGVWGGYLRVQMKDEPSPRDVELPPDRGVWHTFLRVRNGEIENPTPPEVGLRMIELWEAIKKSAKRKGEVVKL